MVTPAYCVAMAAYGVAMNRDLYAAADALGEEGRRADRGAFWRSVHGTLSHLAWADAMWMNRFDGWERPATPLAESDRHVEDWAALRAIREEQDARIAAWAARVDPAWLAGDLTWFSGALGREATRPVGLLVAHLFNHQTHHRGQVHAMLTAAGARPGPTDLFLLVGG